MTTAQAWLQACAKRVAALRSEQLSAVSLVVALIVMLFSPLRPRSVPEAIVFLAVLTIWQRYVASARRLFRWWSPYSAVGKVCVVTGASPGGIGYWTAVQLVHAGAVVIVTCRSRLLSVAAANGVAKEAGLPASVVSSSIRPTNPVRNASITPQGSPGRGPIHSAVGTSGNSTVRVIPMELELEDPESIRRFARQLSALGIEGIDVLVNNAGCVAGIDKRVGRPQVSRFTGFEINLGVNFLGTVEVTRQVLPWLQRRVGARVVTVASQAHRYIASPEEVESLLAAFPYQVAPANAQSAWTTKRVFQKLYGLSKLGNIVHMQHLAKLQVLRRHTSASPPPARSPSSGQTGTAPSFSANRDDAFFLDAAGPQPTANVVHVCAVHPGVVATELFRDMMPARMIGTWLERAFKVLCLAFLKTPFEGSHTTVRCALAPWSSAQDVADHEEAESSGGDAHGLLSTTMSDALVDGGYYLDEQRAATTPVAQDPKVERMMVDFAMRQLFNEV